MFELRLTSALIAAAAVTGFVSPASAIVSLHYYGHGGGHMSTPKTPTYPTPTPKTPMHMGGGYNGGHWGGGHWGSSCCGGGNGSHAVWTKPRLGQHPMGMHYYGMGGHSIKVGTFLRAHFGFRAGYGGGSGSWGNGSHMPSGVHPMGMHYYGMNGGSLAKRYGQLLHPYGTSIPTQPSYAAYSGHNGSRWGYGHWGYNSPTTPTGGGTSTPPSSGGYSGGTTASHSRDSVRFSFKERFSYRYSFHTKSGGSVAHDGSKHRWGSSKPSSWGYTYAVK